MADIINVKAENNTVVIGDNFTGILQGLDFLNHAELGTLRNESIDIISKCTNFSKAESFQTGLVIGYVQSGKTLSFTTVVALAADNNFAIVIVLAGTKLNLLNQTTSRLRRDLHDVNKRVFKVIENPKIDSADYIARTLTSTRQKLLVITILKHNRRIVRLADVLRTPEVQEALTNKPVLIIDDEADQASLNTWARYNTKNNTDDESSTFSSIYYLRCSVKNHTFLQYTATPQAPLLIDLLSSLSPEFYCVISPGEKYTGGSTFFGEYGASNFVEIIPNDEVYHHSTNALTHPPNSLRQALIDFILSSTILLDIENTEEFLGKEDVLSMMVHPSSRTDAINLFYDWCKGFIEGWQKTLELSPEDLLYTSLKSEIETRLKFFSFGRQDTLVFEDIVDDIYERLLEIKVHRVTGADLDIDWSVSSSHILVGGGKLDRGYTVKGLITTYMPRTAVSKSNADTIQQRCRFFGYKLNYLSYCKVYLPLNSIEEYENYVEHEEYLRSILKTTKPEDFSRQFLLDSRLRPTRVSVLSDALKITTLGGAKATSAINHAIHNQSCVNELFEKCVFIDSPFNGTTPDRQHQVSSVSIIDSIDFLLKFKMHFIEDIELKSLLIEYMLYLMDNYDASSCQIYNMAYSTDYRLRGADNQGKIKQLFSGRSTKGSETYVGDRYLQDQDMLAIQIHTVKLETENQEFNQRVIKTLGFVFPSNTITFQGV